MSTISILSSWFLRSNIEKPYLESDLLLDTLLRVFCIFLIILSTCFVLYFSGQWTVITTINLFIIFIGFCALILLKFNHRDVALWLVSITLYLVSIICCIFVDIPSDGMPRSLHHMFIVLALGVFLYLNKMPIRVRLIFPIVCIFTYWFFASTNWGITNSSYSIKNIAVVQHHNRLIYIWIFNSVFFIIMVLLYVFTKVAHIKLLKAQIDLLQGINKQQLELYYKPCSFKGKILCAETYLYWNHLVKGFIPFNAFKTLAENSGLVIPLGSWVLKQVCTQLVRWSQSSLTDAIMLSIKVSEQEFRQEDYVEQVLCILTETGANPKLLNLELAEGILAHSLDDIIAKMAKLRAQGIHISLDDFGTGYSSFSALKRLPIDFIKIDKIFISDILSNQESQAIVRTIVSLANHINVSVIADGVETELQRDLLTQIGCANIQGRLVSFPLTLSQFEVFLNAHY